MIRDEYPSRKMPRSVRPEDYQQPPALNQIVVALRQASTIEPEATQWLWYGWLALRKTHVFAGPAGTGKTQATYSLIATLTNGGLYGRTWPDGSYAPQGDVVIWASEDDVKDTIVPRLMAAGANLNRVHFIEGTVECGAKRPFDPTKDFEYLSEQLAKLPAISLIVIDPIVDLVAGDQNKNADVRRALEPLQKISLDHNCAVLGVTHVTKSRKAGSAQDRVVGSQAFVAVPRIVMMTARINDGGKDCVLVRVKSNIGDTDGGFQYKIAPVQVPHKHQTLHTSAIEWNPEALPGSSETILKWAENPSKPTKESAVDRACSYVFETLASGPVPANLVFENGRACGLSEYAIRNAFRTLGIIDYKSMLDGHTTSFWKMPDQLATPSMSVLSPGAPMIASSYPTAFSPAASGLANYSTYPATAVTANALPEHQLQQVHQVHQVHQVQQVQQVQQAIATSASAPLSPQIGEQDHQHESTVEQGRHLPEVRNVPLVDNTHQLVFEALNAQANKLNAARSQNSIDNELADRVLEDCKALSEPLINAFRQRTLPTGADVDWSDYFDEARDEIVRQVIANSLDFEDGLSDTIESLVLSNLHAYIGHRLSQAGS